MDAAYHLAGGAAYPMKLKLGAAQANPGILMVGGAGTAVGAIPISTTNDGTVPVYGLAIDQGTYSTTQGAAEGIVTVDVRPDLVIRALMSGAATESTALQILQTTSASAGGTTITDTDVGANDFDGGTVWGLSGNNMGLSRGITAHTASTSIVVTVPFPLAIATTDEYLFCPYNKTGTGAGGADGAGWVQTTTLFTQADATVAAGAGVVCSVVDLELNGTTNSYVLFVSRGHAHGSNALAA